MTKEYILNVNGEGFYIYEDSEKAAKGRFLMTCTDFANTRNEEYRNYWMNLYDMVLTGKYILTENFDFRGVRKINN